MWWPSVLVFQPCFPCVFCLFGMADGSKCRSTHRPHRCCYVKEANQRCESQAQFTKVICEHCSQAEQKWQQSHVSGKLICYWRPTILEGLCYSWETSMVFVFVQEMKMNMKGINHMLQIAVYMFQLVKHTQQLEDVKCFDIAKHSQ